MQMNLQEAKALFIAQHHGQKCVISGNEFTIQGHIIDGVYNGIDCYILLRSVDLLTDDEIRNLAIIFYGIDTGISIHKREYYTHVKVGISHFDINSDGETSIFNCESDLMGNELYFDAYSVMSAYQYLLCIGILLPFTYLNEYNKPATLQPEEIIALGWAKKSN